MIVSSLNGSLNNVCALWPAEINAGFIATGWCSARKENLIETGLRRVLVVFNRLIDE
jgi:hypothetical protein